MLSGGAEESARNPAAAVAEDRADDELQRSGSRQRMANLAWQLRGSARARDLVGNAPATRHGMLANGVLLPWVATFNSGALGARALAEGERICRSTKPHRLEPSADRATHGRGMPGVIRVALDSLGITTTDRHATAAEVEEILVSAVAGERDGRV